MKELTLKLYYFQQFEMYLIKRLFILIYRLNSGKRKKLFVILVVRIYRNLLFDQKSLSLEFSASLAILLLVIGSKRKKL
jgi:hypothetical protein